MEHPVSPPLPSIPSSFTPFPGPAKSFTASQSPTALASSEPRNKRSLVAGHIYPSSRASRQIMRIIKLPLDKDGYIWDVIPQEARDFYWEEFQAEKYGCEPAPMEAFTYTHTKEHDGSTFIDRRALGINPVHSAEEISSLWAHVDEQERQLAELREHIMRMSGHHGASTSSSDPPLAIDPHVSTALHQPLSSPLDPDTVDDTLVTPADTTTHLAADTTINPGDTS
ncbi:hypothetical protein JCGZ_10811 [Jatropha curcas]|uniref:Uncharacterized protein n=1 Tax=Jatropha curcas TaxID=180498 RepID=A0A067KK92_JATCU|nr:hypothetical protein JCGZ_10811 [Jatropha curcas]